MEVIDCQVEERRLPLDGRVVDEDIDPGGRRQDLGDDLADTRLVSYVASEPAARPIPRPPPVTIATRSSSLPIVVSPLPS
jgi:hypothetical protein